MSLLSLVVASLWNVLGKGLSWCFVQIAEEDLIDF